ncbi:ATP-binding protein [Micromonospora coxensis]|uniref:ATP-binding protein n=1 Tax=Micromonospora coxensis TaxID=356852 RepID=UPI00343B7D8C
MTNADPPTPRTVVPIESSLLIAEAFDQAQVTELRHSVTSCAHAAGLGGQRLDDFVLAVNELITNAVRHGGGQGSLRLWRRSEELVCEVADHGRGISAQRLGDRSRPAADTAGGWGLWLARELSDAMEVETSAAGTTVRISTAVTAERRARAE